MGFRRGWVCLFLFMLVTINYLDRTTLSIVAKDVAAEFGLSPVGMGYLFSSFVWTYSLCILPAGILVDRFSTKAVNSFGIGLWSLATMLTAGTWNFGSLLAMRLTMGVGEATSIPACQRAVREWMPASERGMATTIFSGGSAAGVAIGAVVVGTVSSHYGWRASFIVAGALGFVWLVFFRIWFDTPERAKWLSEEERAKILGERGGREVQFNRKTSLAEIIDLIKARTIWGLIITQASTIYANNVFLFWLPSYLQTTKHLTVLKTGLFTAVPYAIAVPLSIGLGILSDRMLNPGGVLAGRRRAMVIAVLLCSAVVLLTPLLDNIWLILACVTISLTGISAALALNIALTSDLLHNPRATGKAVSTVIVVGQLVGIFSPIVTGYVIATLGSYDWAFLIAGIFLLVGATSSYTMTRKPIVIVERVLA